MGVGYLYLRYVCIAKQERVSDDIKGLVSCYEPCTIHEEKQRQQCNCRSILKKRSLITESWLLYYEKYIYVLECEKFLL